MTHGGPFHCRSPIVILSAMDLKEACTKASQVKTRARCTAFPLRLAQTIGWILLLSITVVSIVPAELRPDTTLPHDLEHARIYLLAGCAFGLSYPDRFLGWLIGLSSFTLAIEIAQLWVPGRHARVTDSLVDVFSVGVGLSVGAVLLPLALFRVSRHGSPLLRKTYPDNLI
jgi:VanZ family protein